MPSTSKVRTKAELKYFKDDANEDLPNHGDQNQEIEQEHNDLEENQGQNIDNTSFIVSQSEFEFVQDLGHERQECLIQEFDTYLNN